MTKGTQSFGKRHTKSHILCVRCGRRAYHVQKKTCASCGYPSAKTRSYNWSVKAKRRRCTGTGRMAHLKEVHRRFRNASKQRRHPIKRSVRVAAATTAAATPATAATAAQ
eukprot:GEZU01030395.1.p1 GENE.GEZU01030395.1~~GEZU01030395.1.p1  ORF type:complete len:110 (+),score=16.55 GEZU01030395.1:66-395(+)